MNVREFARTADRIRLGDACPSTKAPDLVVHGLLSDFVPDGNNWGIDEVYQASLIPDGVAIQAAVRRALGGRIELSAEAAAVVFGPPPPSVALAKGSVNSSWKDWTKEQRDLWRRCRSIAEERLEIACPDGDARVGWASWWALEVVRRS